MKSFFAFLVTVLATGTLCAQTTSIQLSTPDSLSDFRILPSVGSAILKISGDGGFYVAGNNSAGAIPAKGAGARLMWYPAKKAFRAGYAGATDWEDVNIGNYSSATGSRTIASGDYSTATGCNTAASNYASTAMGYMSTASEYFSVAIGCTTLASGNSSVAIGSNTTASGLSSIAMGTLSTASGNYSTALGYSNSAEALYGMVTGQYSAATAMRATAIGYHDTASGTQTVAMGSYATANYNGSFVFGDNSTSTPTSCSNANEITMRFAGGYRFYTNSALSTGSYMSPNTSGWNNYCDRNKKENFLAVDGEQILEKIRTMPINEWNYKGTDPSIRYIGPVAQDFYSAFHLGGTDSLGINSISIDGVNMAAIQALEKRTSELRKANEKIAQLEKLVSEQDIKLQAQQTSFDELKKEIAKIKSDVQLLTESKSKQENTDVTLHITNKEQ